MNERIDYRGLAMSHEWIMDDFIQTGGTIVWEEESDTRACATFAHPETGKAMREKTAEKIVTLLVFPDGSPSMESYM